VKASLPGLEALDPAADAAVDVPVVPPSPVQAPSPMQAPLPSVLNHLRDTVTDHVTAQVARLHLAARSATDDPARAIHGFRRALRRIRSTLHLVERALPHEIWRDLDHAVRDVARHTSALRDAEILPDTLNTVVVADREALDVWRIELDQARLKARAAGTSGGLLRAGAVDLQPVAETFGGQLEPEIRWRHLARGLRDTWKRAKKARRAAEKRPNPKLIHEFRKRVKDVRWQLELVASVAPQAQREGIDALAALARGLGGVTDLIALRTWVRAHSGGGESRQLLLTALDAAIAQGFEEALRVSDVAFQEKSKKLSSRVRSWFAETGMADDADPEDD
jgi:CHAD domain-containing protein